MRWGRPTASDLVACLSCCQYWNTLRSEIPTSVAETLLGLLGGAVAGEMTLLATVLEMISRAKELGQLNGLT